jgi:hypothetical protein
MLEKFKNISLLSKILYALALLLLLLWVAPTAMGYYSNVSKYQENTQEISLLSKKYAIDGEAQPFSSDAFKEEAEKMFSSVTVTVVNETRHTITIKMKREELSDFHKFIESISLRYLVEIEGALEFNTADNEEIEVNITLVQI